MRKWKKEWKTYLLHDDSQDQTGIDLGILGDLDDSVVESTLLGAAVVLDHGSLLVEVEHGGEVHPLVERREVLLDAAIADIVVLVGISVVASGEVGVVPLETITSDHRSDTAESARLNRGHTDGDLRALERVGAREVRSDRAGSCKSQERSNSENLEKASELVN